MTCKGCGSDRQSVFNGEIAIHFRGLEGLDKPIVWVFPKVVVCLLCGFTEFTVPERELGVIVKGTAVEGAVVFDERDRGKKVAAQRQISPGEGSCAVV
jgi:hypothetical protein